MTLTHPGVPARYSVHGIVDHTPESKKVGLSRNLFTGIEIPTNLCYTPPGKKARLSASIYRKGAKLEITELRLKTACLSKLGAFYAGTLG